MAEIAKQAFTSLFEASKLVHSIEESDGDNKATRKDAATEYKTVVRLCDECIKAFEEAAKEQAKTEFKTKAHVTPFIAGKRDALATKALALSKLKDAAGASRTKESGEVMAESIALGEEIVADLEELLPKAEEHKLEEDAIQAMIEEEKLRLASIFTSHGRILESALSSYAEAALSLTKAILILKGLVVKNETGNRVKLNALESVSDDQIVALIRALDLRMEVNCKLAKYQPGAEDLETIFKLRNAVMELESEFEEAELDAVETAFMATIVTISTWSKDVEKSLLGKCNAGIGRAVRELLTQLDKE